MNDNHQKTLIVCNSGPLIALVSVGCLYILHRLFQRIIIPNTVYQEITLSKELPGAIQITKERCDCKKSFLQSQTSEVSGQPPAHSGLRPGG